MATKPRMPPAGMMSGTPMNNPSQGEAMPVPAPTSMQDQQMQGDQLYTEDEMKEHGLKCAVLSKWDTVLRQLYFENAGDPKRQIIAATLFELMVHFGFENPPEEGQQPETA